MATMVNENPEDRMLRRFIQAFDDYLIVRMVSREYELHQDPLDHHTEDGADGFTRFRNSLESLKQKFSERDGSLN